MSEDRPKNRLFNTPKAIKPLLDFLSATNIGQRPNESEEEEENWDRLDRWDLGRLDSEDEDEEEEGDRDRLDSEEPEATH
jgi:hypothetical protein